MKYIKHEMKTKSHWFKNLMQGAKYGLENGSLLFWEQDEWVIQLKGVGWVQPLDYFANLDLLNTWILLFWCLRKANLKG